MEKMRLLKKILTGLLITAGSIYAAFYFLAELERDSSYGVYGISG
jgi:hypothetical protein